VWRTIQSLPVSLCYRVEFELPDGKTLAGRDMVVHADEGDHGYFPPADPIEAYEIMTGYAAAEGFIDVTVHLTPSRTLALSDIKIQKYYGEKISSQQVRFRLDPPKIDPDELP
jgi:hypothetical protein